MFEHLLEDHKSPFKHQLEAALSIVNKVVPNTRADYACMMVASALAGMRGLTMKHIAIGSLFWPDRFTYEKEPGLSMRGGWGCEGYSQADGKLWLSEIEIDDDGGFRGHTWLEPNADTVVDLMHDNPDSYREIHDKEFKTVGRYIRRRPLERLVKNFWRSEMNMCIKLGRIVAK